MEVVKDWKDKKLICSKCGSSINVKYQSSDELYYCDMCGWNTIKELVTNHKTRLHCKRCGESNLKENMIEVNSRYYCMDCYDAIFEMSLNKNNRGVLYE